MKLKKTKYGKISIFTAICMLAFACIFAGCGQSKEEAYRLIKVLEISGTAGVERQGDVMEAYPDMQLQSGDIVTTGEGSYAQLRLDEDKYILLEAETKIILEASGNGQDSKTTIRLEQGAIVNRLDNELNDNSSYQVTVPNSTMAVRGTIFRVEVTYDDVNGCNAVLSVYDGTVQCNLKLPDQSLDTNDVMVVKGTQVLVWGDETDARYADTKDVEYRELEKEVLQFLYSAIENEHELSIAEEELMLIIEAAEQLEKQQEMPVETPRESATVTPTEEPKATATLTPSPVPTETPKATESKTATPTPVATPTVAPTPVATPTMKPVVTPAPIEPDSSYTEDDDDEDNGAGESVESIPSDSSGLGNSGGDSAESQSPESSEAPSYSPATSEAPSATPETTPEATPETTETPTATPEATPETTETPTATPETTPEATPATSEAPSATPETTPEATPETTETPAATPAETPPTTSE